MAMSEKLARQAQAEALLRNELLVEGFDNLVRDYIEAWKATPVRDTDARERYWQAVQIVEKVRQHLKSVIDTGKLAQAELDHVAKLGERRKVFGIV